MSSLPADDAARPDDESVQPIVIRKLDRLETTSPSGESSS
jgi:hypothetical protein